MEQPDERPDIDSIEREDTRQRLPGLGKFASFTPFLIPILLALVISWAMVSVMAAPKGAYRADITRLEMDIVAIREAGQPDLQPLVEADQIAQTQRASLSARIDTLANQINNFQQVAPDLTGYAKTTDLSSYAKTTALIPYATKAEFISLADLPTTTNARLTAYEKLIAENEADLAKLEDAVEELWLLVDNGEATAADEETKWEVSIYCTNLPPSQVEVDPASVHISPTRIEEADDYIISVPLLNYRDGDGTGYVREAIIQIRMTPKSGDRVEVDEGEIYLDSAYYPFTLWSTDIVKRDDDSCRRLVFTSDKIILPAPASDATKPSTPETTIIRLDFTLGYD